jgi:hypothetical protein
MRFDPRGIDKPNYLDDCKKLIKDLAIIEKRGKFDEREQGFSSISMDLPHFQTRDPLAIKTFY